MSHQMVSRVLEHSQARGPAKAILIVLAHHDYGNAGWTTDLGVLTWESGFGISTVKRALTELIDLGEITKTAGGKGIRAHYELLLQCPEACETPKQHHLEKAQSGLPSAEDSPERATSKPRVGYIKGSERTSPSKEGEGAGRLEPPAPSALGAEVTSLIRELRTRPDDGDATWWADRLTRCHPAMYPIVLAEYRADREPRPDPSP